MKKLFKKINRTQEGFTFSAEEKKVHDLKVGKTYDLSDMIEVKKDSEELEDQE